MGGYGFLCPLSNMTLMKDLVALLQHFRDLGLVLIGGIVWKDVEVFIREEGMHFVLVVLLVYDDYGFALVSLCDYSIVLSDFVVNVVCNVSLSLVCS